VKNTAVYTSKVVHWPLVTSVTEAVDSDEERQEIRQRKIGAELITDLTNRSGLLSMFSDKEDEVIVTLKDRS
jgi:hypothetical protein